MNKNLVFEREKKIALFCNRCVHYGLQKNFDQPLAIFHRQKKKNVWKKFGGDLASDNFLLLRIRNKQGAT